MLRAYPLLFALLLAPGSIARAAGTLPAERLVQRFRLAYTQPTEFSPAALRFPLRSDLEAELKAARQAVSANPADVEGQWKLAQLKEAAEDPEAEEQWRSTLELIEAQAKSRPRDALLLERQVVAMIGANVALRAVPQAEALAKLQPESWRAQLLLGDAYFRRADFNWRVLLERGRGGRGLTGPELLQLGEDLKRAEKAYGQAVSRAPAEAGPRSASISLRLGKSLMAALLPKGALVMPDRPDLAAVWNELLELVRRNPGKIDPIWHAAHFLATQGSLEPNKTAMDRQHLQSALSAVPKEGERRLFWQEAQGLLAVGRKDWSVARQEFEAAVAVMPSRRFARGWLAMAELNCSEPEEQVVSRVRKRLAERPTPEDATALGVLLGTGNRAAAIETLRQALELNRDFAPSRYNLAVLLAQQDPASPEARYQLRRTLELEPDNWEALYCVAVLDALDGRIAPARKSLTGYLTLPDLEPDLKLRLQQTLADLPESPR